MLVMGIDSSSEIGAVGISDSNGISGDINIRLVHRHSEELLSNIDFLLKQSGYRMADLEGLSVTIGPGSFTGLRIGLSTARTFAQVLDIPIIGVSSLDVLAYNMALTSKWLVPVIDAKRNRVYTAIYQGWSQDIDSVKVSADKAVNIDNLIKELRALDSQGEFIFLGDGSIRYQQFFEGSALDIQRASIDKNIPHGGVIAELGRYYLEQGKSDNYLEITPNYLKKPQAEINWLKKHG